MAASQLAKGAMRAAKSSLQLARSSPDRGTKVNMLLAAHHFASLAGEQGGDEMFLATADQLVGEAHKELYALCGVQGNPSRAAAYGALGAGAGALLLGPLGAAAGGYLGARKGQKRKSKKKNPDRTKILRAATRGT